MKKKSKNCPWCEHRLPVFQLLLLDDYSPTICRNCGQFVRNIFVNLILPVLLPVVLCFIAYYLVELELVFVPSFLFLVPVLRIFLAEPIKYSR